MKIKSLGTVAVTPRQEQLLRDAVWSVLKETIYDPLLPLLGVSASKITNALATTLKVGDRVHTKESGSGVVTAISTYGKVESATVRFGSDFAFFTHRKDGKWSRQNRYGKRTVEYLETGSVQPRKLPGQSKLIEAIKSGRISYQDGQFSGRLSVEISKQLRDAGAYWDKRNGAYVLDLRDMPQDIKSAIDRAQNDFDLKLGAIDEKLESMQMVEITIDDKFAKIFDKIILQTESKLDKTLGSIIVAPNLTVSEKLRIQAEWRDNMTLDIKTFADSEVRSLRNRIAKNVLAGKRIESVVDSVRYSYGVSRSKAKFLARQETHLLTAKLQELRCTKAGVDDYHWRCVRPSALHPVRPMHLALDGTEQKFSAPPVTNPKGDRNNPGEDYNCRCMAVPFVRMNRT